MKSDVKSEVGGEIAADADYRTPNEAAQINNIAGNIRQKAVDEYEQTDREVERGRVVTRVSQVIDYVFFVIYGLLAIRLLLKLSLPAKVPDLSNLSNRDRVFICPVCRHYGESYHQRRFYAGNSDYRRHHCLYAFAFGD